MLWCKGKGDLIKVMCVCVCVFVLGDRPSPLPDIMTLPVARFFKETEEVEKEHGNAKEKFGSCWCQSCVFRVKFFTEIQTPESAPLVCIQI